MYEGNVYILWGEGTPWYKIGTSKAPERRLTGISVQLPFKCKVIRVFRFDDMPLCEGLLHRLFADKRVNGEWFTLSQQDVEWLLSLKAVTYKELERESKRWPPEQGERG